MADLQLTLLEVTLEDALLGAPLAEQSAHRFGVGTGGFGLLDSRAEGAGSQSGGGELLEQQLRVALVQGQAVELEGLVRGAFFGQGEEGADLHAVGTECHRGEHAFARGNATGGHERQVGDASHGGDEAERGGLLATVMSARLEAFGHDGVDARGLAFGGKA